MPSLTEIETLDFSQPSSKGGERLTIGLTLLCHPDANRVGQISVLFSAELGGSRKLSRLEPEFRHLGQTAGEPPATALMSRKALVIRTTAEGRIRLEKEDASLQVAVEGELLEQAREFDKAALARGLALEIGSAVLVLLHFVATVPHTAHSSLLGESLAIRRVREEIARVADAPVSVLIRGATGTGKELAARAIHAASTRSAGPFVAVNMAAIPESVASSALFGHARGAFTGAQQASDGYFVAAQGGTLLLDEIGETPRAIQGMLLRAIREGEIQPVGGTQPRPVDVRVLSATDAPLEHLVEAGEFSLALLQRIAGYTLALPLLRERRDDIARLFYAFLRVELRRYGQESKLVTVEGGQPYVTAALVRTVVSQPYAGNVAELEALVTRLAIASRDRSQLKLDPTLLGVIAPSGEVAPGPLPAAHNPNESQPPTPTRASESRPKRAAQGVTDAEIVEAMRRARFSADAAARELGVSRAWLFARLESCAGIRMAKQLSEAEVKAMGDAKAWNVAEMAEALEVSHHALRLRMAQLGLSK